jgi:hypothetical protein
MGGVARRGGVSPRLALFRTFAWGRASTAWRGVEPGNDGRAAATVPTNLGSGALAGTSADAGSDGGGTPLPIEEIRAVLTEAPELAEQLVRADQERFPDRPDADERDALLVAAVYNQHQPTRARKEARVYFRKHPNGRFKDFLQKGTGASVPPPASSSP